MKRARTRSRLEDHLSEQAFKGIESRVDFSNRRVFLTGDVDDEAVSKFLIGLSMMDASKGAIEVVLASAGGNVNGGFGIYDAIRLSQNQIIIKVYGEVMSIAMLCLQAGDKRLVSPTSRGMMHDGYEIMNGTFNHNELLARGKEFVEANQIYYEVLASRSKLSIDEIRKMCQKETYMSATQMVKSGLADGIIESKKGKQTKCRKR